MEDVAMESDNEEEYTSYFKPSYVIVAIDTHCSMFKSEGQPTPFKNCMKALYRLSDFLLLKSDKRGWSPFSVCLYDKDEKATLVNFKDNMIETSKLLKQKSNLSEEELKKQFMRSYDLDLAAFFQLTKRKFKDVSTKYYRRILIFITNDPDPVLGEASKRFTALHEAKNFGENDIDFQLVVTNESFDYRKFYFELFSLLNKPQQEIICEDEEGLFEKIISTICFRHSQRKLCFYPFLDDFTKYITVIRKSYIKYERLLNTDFVAVDCTLVKRVTQNTPEEGASSSDSKYVLHNVDTKDYFEQEFSLNQKMESYHSPFPIGYTLLYVCHRLSGIGEVINEPRILEADVKEELPYFNKFWQFCVNQNKVLVCAQVLKKGEPPKAVELIPKLIHGNKVFLTKDIAHADEIFEPEKNVEGDIILTDEQKNITDAIINQLSFEFQSSFLIDEAYLKKVEYLKSKLLEEERKEVDTKDLLTSEEIDEKIGGIMDGFHECFPPERAIKRKLKEK